MASSGVLGLAIRLLLALVPAVSATSIFDLSYNGLAPTPQMGWDSYNTYAYTYDESTLQENARRLVDLGLRDLGYKVIILDDAWALGRGSDGKQQVNTTKFPSGLKTVGDRFHSMGLQLGMYSSAGKYTCGGWPGSLGYEKQDAELFASFGADYLKYDNCFNEGQSGTPLLSYNRYKAMSDALNATGRPMLYSLCNWGDDKTWDWASVISNSYRISGDIYDAFDRPQRTCPCGPDEYYCQLPGYACSVMNILYKASFVTQKTQKGAWPDLDLLEVGNGGMTDSEYVTHFSMWAANKSPLIMGNNLGALSPADFSILNNAAVIAINQDPAGNSIQLIWRYDTAMDKYGQGTISLWSGGLANGDQVVALLNAGPSPLQMNATLVDIFGGIPTAKQAQQSWDIYDLWAGRMASETAAAILNGTMAPSDAKGYYNATAKSFAQGLEQEDPLLFGKKIGNVPAGGTVTAMVPTHGTAFYRLRASTSNSKRSEL